MSLVQGQSVTGYRGLIGRFAAAFTASSFIVFAVVGSIGLTMARLLTGQARLGVTCAVLLGSLTLDTWSLKRKSWCPVTLRRQTPKSIAQRHGARRAAVAWGLDTGLVFTTYRTSSISWALLALAVIGVTPWWAGLGYATGFLVPLVAGCSLIPFWRNGTDATVLAEVLVRRSYIAKTACMAALAAAMLITGSRLL